MKSHNIEGFNKELDKKRYEIISDYFRGKTCLEIGPGNGHMTKKLTKMFNKVSVVEEEKSYIALLNKIKKTNKKIQTICESIKCNCTKKFDTIICTNVIEHLNKPEEFLKDLKKFAHYRTKFIFSVPNAKSFNRLLGLEIGVIKSIRSLHKNDLKVGHKKIYDYSEMRDLISSNGFTVDHIFTKIYKPFANDVMDKLPNSVKKFCLDIDLDEFGAEIFVIARLE